MARVVVTGMSGYSPIGNSWIEIEANLRAQKNGVQYMRDWDAFEGLNTRLGAPVKQFDLPDNFIRKRIRTMSRVSMLATAASQSALQDAGLLDDPVLKSGRAGVAYGSSTGSTEAIGDFARMLNEKTTSGITATTYIRMMGHTCAVNIGVFFGLQGRVLPTSTACTSGSLGIGCAAEAIWQGAQDVMIAGGAEELSVTEAAVFDTLYATSTFNDSPELSPRPFDSDRDGLVIGEGACTLILENRDHALARGAHIYAEIVGFATNSDGRHVTQPSPETMQTAIRMSLENANLPASEIGYVSAHGTATDRGDVAESLATQRIFGPGIPISSLKSYMGHTLGACGALESWLSIEMMNNGWFAPTANLENIDPKCAELDYIQGKGRELDVPYVMNNNFAFGGINTSLVFSRHPA